MIKQTYQLQLITPAFLGDAEQKGVWRTPPLKALIREWWRVAVAADCGYDASRLKTREKTLFGTAADDPREGNQKSRVRLALAHWHSGKLTDWGKVNPGMNGKPGQDPKVKHDEVDFAGGMVGSQLYLGYGPLLLEKGNPNTKLKKNAALQDGEYNTLKLALPDDESETFQRAITLADWFGTVGGRSRNGWGSLLWTAEGETPGLVALSNASLQQHECIRPLEQCLDLDWPHAIGMDATGPLVWRSRETFRSWRDAMKFLAQTKIGFRVHLGFDTGKNSLRVEARHVLAYPITNHSVRDWGNNARLANTLRFKVHREDDGSLRALVYHTPCKPTLPHAGIDLLDTWQRVHRFLDDQPSLNRLP